MKILNNDTNEHIQYEEANQEQERYEVDQPPFVVILNRLKIISHVNKSIEEGKDQQSIPH